MLNLVRIPAGKFLMGSPDSDTNAKPIERPRAGRGRVDIHSNCQGNQTSHARRRRDQK